MYARQPAGPGDVRIHAAELDHEQRGGFYRSRGKRVIDVSGGLLLALVSLPLVLALSLLVAVRVRGNPFFRQTRVGRFGRPFTIIKLRTMIDDRRTTHLPFAGDDRRKTHKSAADPRVFGLGRFLRRWSLDELPQFWNVIRGDMSLVGPRPEMPEIVATYEPWQHRRHRVRPGLTGLWQVSERGDRPLHEATALDLEYVERLSMRLDLAILARTIPAALGSRRGY